MIDYFSIELNPVIIQGLLCNPNLDFESKYSIQTGEIEPHNQRHQTKKAVFKGLEIFIYESKQNTGQKKVYLKGSIHKFFTGGTNYSDFNFESLKTALNSLKSSLGICLDDSKVHSIEFGVNIELPYSCKGIIKQIISYSGTTPSECSFHGKGQLIRFVRSQHILKIYNKGLQYFNSGHLKTNPDNLLRYELHIDKMQYLNAKGIDLNFLSDLLEHEVIVQLSSVLLDSFKDLIFFDPTLLKVDCNDKTRLFLTECSNPKYWNSLRSSNKPKQYARKLKKYRQLIDKLLLVDNSKIMYQLIRNKTEYLSKNVPFLPMSKNDKMSCFYSYVLSRNRTNSTRVCEVTGMDISRQSKTSKFLSESSINKIEMTDPELYSKLVETFSPKQQGANQNHYIAHNIRNTKFNGKHNFIKQYKRVYSNTTLFAPEEVFTLSQNQTTILIQSKMYGSTKNPNCTK